MAVCVVVPMGPACIDLAGIRAGDRNTILVTLSSNGMPVDLTGLTVAAQARKKATDPDPPALTAICAVVNAALGQVTVRWDGDDVRTLMNGSSKWTGVWDLQVDSPTDDPVTIAAGKFTAEADVTRP